MPFTVQDLADFNRFAEGKLSDGGIDNIDQLIREWQEAREAAEVVQGVLEGEAEYEAGGGRPLDKVVEKIRENLTK